MPKNEHHINAIEYSIESSDDEETNMRVAECSWGSKSKPFVCSILKPASKTQQEEVCYTFDVAKCDKIFDYLLQEKKLNCQVVMSYHRQNSLKSMHIINGIILILMLLMIAMFSVNRFNRP
jgi:ABC-type Na+ transport system ATPase subunit NatA